MSVIEVLKTTPKGQLSYSSLWDRHTTPEQTLKLIKDITSPPNISHDAAQHRMKTHRLTPPTLGEEQRHESFDAQESSPEPPGLDSYSKSPQPQSPIKILEEEVRACQALQEDEIKAEVKEAMTERRQSFYAQRNSNRNYNDASFLQDQFHRTVITQIEREERRQEEEMELELLVEKEIKLLDRNHAFHIETMEKRVHATEQKLTHELQRLELQRREMLRQEYRKLKEDAINFFKRITSLLQSCLYHQYLHPNVLKQIKNISEQIQQIINFAATQEQSSNPDDAKLAQLKALLSGFQPFLPALKDNVEKVNVAVEAERQRLEEQKRQLEEQEKLLKEKQKKAEEQQQQHEAATSTQTSKEIPSAGKSGISISSSALQQYQTLQDKLKETEQCISSLTKTTDPQIKKYRFDLQKAINTPVSAISSQSGGHLLDKLRRIKQLLSGNPVEVIGRRVSVSQHKDAKMFCLNLLAKILVKQGEEQVSSRSDTAFPFAGLIVSLWSEYPEFGSLFLAHCHASCPVLVPMYFHKQSGMKEVDYLKLQGYKISEEGVAESEDVYLRRMSGIIRIYAAVLQTPALIRDKPHPHGLENGWVWLARVLNTNPEPGITATALLDVLEVAGHALARRYGKQFQKMLSFLCNEYLPRIERVTPDEQRGPYSRLEIFLENCIKQKSIPEPNGMLSNEFWKNQRTTDIFKA